MRLRGAKVAIVAGPEYEDLELHYPLLRVIEEGATARVIGPEKVEYRGKRGLSIVPDCTFGEVNPEEFDALLIPGGWMPDRLRRDDKVVSWIRRFFESGKLVGAICHGPQLLISAKVVRGYKLTAVSAIKDDLENAGAIFIDAPTVHDRNLVTARIPADLPIFMRTFVSLLAERAIEERAGQRAG